MTDKKLYKVKNSKGEIIGMRRSHRRYTHALVSNDNFVRVYAESHKLASKRVAHFSQWFDVSIEPVEIADAEEWVRVNKERFAHQLKARLEASVSRINEALSTLTLNDLSDAVTDMDAVEIALAKSQSSWGELFVDVDGSSLAPFHEEVSESFETFREAIEEGNQRITSMIDDGLADEGNEEYVQRVMEEEVLPPLDSALQELQDLVP